MTKKRDVEKNITEKVDNTYAVNKTPSSQIPPKPAMQDMLGDKLRSYYDKMASEPVPDRFERLLKELELSQSSQKRK